MTAPVPPPRIARPPLAVAAVLLVVTLLFGAAAFVAGLNVAGGAAADPSASVPPSNAAVETPRPTPAATPNVETVTCTEPSGEFALLCDTYARIKADYVDEVSDEVLVEGAVQGMVEALPDPYSGYIPPEHYANALDDLSGEFSGIGAEVGVENLEDPDASDECTVITNACALVIVAPLDGSPAEAAGLRSGDVVLAVDGESTLGSTIQQEVLEVRGESGTDVTLTVQRDEERHEITITRAVIELITVESRMLDGGIGFVRLAQFTEEAPAELTNALRGLLDTGATEIVFDLRNNPGGFINAAQEVASQFIGEGLLFTQESGETVVEWTSQPGGVATDPAIELVVLINEGSASASEIVAAAIQETGRGTLVGQPTFGKNTVQVWADLGNGGALRLTTDRWFPPSHRSVEGDGVQPDVAVEVPEDVAADEDPILDRALELLSD